MLSNTKLIFSTVIILSISFAGCKRWVELPPPSSTLTNETVFSDNGTATAALLNIYAGGLQSESWNMSQNCGLLADELYGGYSRNPNLLQYYFNALGAQNSPGPWINYYQFIYQTNDLIEGLEKGNDAHSLVKQQLLGEARFLRAFFYFYLTICYGDVPLVLTTDYTINSKISRSQTGIVFDQILDDLQKAKIMLNDNFVDASDTVVTVDRIRPTSWAAMALLARVYLFQKKYDSAYKYSSLVLENENMFGLSDSLNDVFLVNSKESIWQLATTSPVSRNTIDGNNFILKSRPGAGSTNTVTITDQLYSSFEQGDLRKSHWIGKLTIAGKDYLFPNKYKAYRSLVVTERTSMLRLAEQYLIRAESEIYNGDLISAFNDINRVRRRAGLDNYSGLMDRQHLLDAVMRERRVEYFSEWGHRWFDLIRTNSIDGVMSVTCPQKGGTWFSSKHLFPIPQSEREVDHFLSQNDGY